MTLVSPLSWHRTIVALAHWITLILQVVTGADGDDDTSLMQAYVAGDMRAFDTLYARYHPRILALMRRRLRDEAEAADLTQQAFLQLHRARHDYRAGQDPYKWLVTIALNLYRDAAAKYARRRRLQDEHLDEERVVESVTRLMERSETAEAVRAAMLHLPGGTRDVIELHWFQELSFADVAKQLGCSASAARVRAHRGYERLRGLLTGAVHG